MITMYLRSGEVAEVFAETVEPRLWELADGSSTSSLVCLDEAGDVVAQFVTAELCGWAYSPDEEYDEDD
jgi:hypothetical protein